MVNMCSFMFKINNNYIIIIIIGVHAIVMNIWKNKDTGPIMQIVHFLFAFGAFLSPLIAKPFISEEPSESINNTQLYNLSCFEVLEMATPNVTNDVCLSEVIDNCFNQSGDLSGDGFTNVTDCSNTSGGNLFFGYAYWIAVIPLLISIPGLLFYSVKEQCFCLQWKKKVPIEVTEDEERLQIDSDEEIEVHVDSEKEKEKELRYPNTILYKVFLFTSLFMFMYCYVGLEVSYGTYVFAFAVKGDLGFSKQRAALLSSVFWGSFAFARCFSIAISLCKTPPSFMMAGNLTGSLVASLLMVIWNNTETVIWIGSALLGASFASIFPTVMTWLSRHTIPTAKATAVLNTGALLGDMTLPLLVGLLLDNLAPVSLLYINIIFVGIAVLICVCMVTVVELWGRKWRKHRQQHFRYQRLQFNNVELTLVRDVTSEGDGCDDVTSDNREEENSFDNEEEIDT